ncbi:MAG: DPP IV N-terminal domain-containing protein [Alistipes sp.]|nr:DPP IV N-terminal domain-containing protein [Alistipes sp.]
MIKRLTMLMVAAATIALAAPAQATEPEAVKPNYELAERFSPTKVRRLVPQTMVHPNWFENSTKFWYSWTTVDGTNYYIVDPASGKRTELWSMAELAEKVTLDTNYPFDAQHLPIRAMELKEDKYVLFDIAPADVMVENNDYAPKDDEGNRLVFHFKWDIASKSLERIEERDVRYPEWANVSPDGRIAVYEKNYNLWYMTTEDVEKLARDPKDSTIVEHQITTDATDATAYHWFEDCIEQIKPDERYRVFLQWSPDSKHFATVRSNTSMLKDFWVINVLKERPELFSYKYQMPGEESPHFWLELFNAETMERREVDMTKYKEQMLFICNRPAMNADRYDKPNRVVWQGDNDKFYVIRQSRDIQRADLCVVDVATATAKDLIVEEMNTSIEWQMPTLISNNSEIIQWSERTGWAHLYRYTADGELINQITKGEWHVSNVLGADDAKRVIYFTATGYNKDENPYYLHLFRVNYDGTGLKQLDPKDFNGTFSLSDDRRYFTTTYSRVDAAPVSELYTTDGRKVMTLETVDLEPLFAIGYQYPEPFVVKAADGITDLHGVMYKPYDFDPNKKYPIIEYVYPGPQTEAVEQSWYHPLVRTDRLAQLGFIVITVGNRGGHPDRSKWYHNYGYGNLRDYGLKDKVVAAQQLAAQHSYIDITRVGIHGHSGGGFMSTAAILMYPDFFDVAVSCAGNHDNNIYNRWWSEKHHGISEVEEGGEIVFNYHISANHEIADRLKGNLLLVHGDIDENVHPGNTLRVVNALIRSNKRFDMLLLPGQRHGFGDMNEYFFWRMADYFSEHLLGERETSTDIPQLNNDI